jgi:COP9 signalosome complex subunit 2
MKGDNPEEAIDEFLGVPALEEEKGDWYAIMTQLRYNADSQSASQGI